MSLYSELQILIDEVTGPVFWSNSQLLDALNISQMETFTYLHGVALTSSTLAVPTGADILVWDTVNIMIPQYLLDTASNKLFITEHAQLQDYSSGWINQPAARPKFAIRWDSTRLRLWPRADQNYVYTIFGVPWPEEIVSSAVDPAYDQMVRKAIVHRAASRLLEFTQPELSDIYEAQAVEFEKRYGKQLRNSGGANTWRLAPARGWQAAQLGNIKTGNKYY